MPTPEQITRLIDIRLAGLLPAITARQEKHLAQHGKYFQGLPTHGRLPADGIDAPPDKLDRTPGSQKVTWRDLGGDIIPARLLSQLEIHQYESPKGPGWQMFLRLTIDGKIWERSIGHGPEDRSYPWRVQPPTPLLAGV